MKPNKELCELHKLYNKCEVTQIWHHGITAIGKCKTCGAAFITLKIGRKGTIPHRDWNPMDSRTQAAKRIRNDRAAIRDEAMYRLKYPEWTNHDEDEGKYYDESDGPTWKSLA